MNMQQNFPPGWDERMTLDKANLWDPSDYAGYKKMGIIRGNDALERTFQRTQSMLPKLVAQVRWGEYGLNQRDYAKELGLSPHGYTSMEKDMEGRQPQFHVYHFLLKDWELGEMSAGIREQCLDLLTMPDIFEQENLKNGETYDPQKTLLQVIEEARNGVGHTLNHLHMSAFYHRIGYDVGHPNITEYFPTLWGILHTRGIIGTVPGAVEVLDVVDTMYTGEDIHTLRRVEGKELWYEVKKNQYRNRGIEEPMVELLTAMEFDVADNWEWDVSEGKETSTAPMTFRVEAIKECYGLTDLPAMRLMQTEFLEWEDVEDIASGLMNSTHLQKFKGEWQACLAAEKKRESFSNMAIAAMKERGFTYKDIADMLGLEIQKDRRKKTEDEKSTRDRPESQIRQIINYNKQSSQVAIESLLRILAQDDERYAVLRTAYEQERERYFRRTGSGLEGKGLHMRILRELGNVSMKNLARQFLPKNKQANDNAVREKDIELQRLERNEGNQHRISFKKVFAILEAEIVRKAEEADVALDSFDDFPEELKKFTTVDQMAANCTRGMQGANMVSEAMRDIARNDSEWLRPPVVQAVAEKSFIPPLPTLRVMAKSTTDQVLASDVVRDWHEKFPHQLAAGCSDFSRFTFTKPLPRCLATQIGSVESKIIRFFEKQTQGITPTRGTKFLDRLEHEDVDEKEWEILFPPILLGVGRKPNHIHWKLADLLFHNGQDVRKAVMELLPELQKRKIEIHPENLPGLYLDELTF